MTISRRVLLAVLLFGSILAWIVAQGIAWSYAEPENYSRIERGLYLGGDVESPPRGVTAVLNVCEVRDPYRTKVYAWEPIRDAPPAPSLDWLRRRAEFIDENRRAGRPVFVHCVAGVSRSPTVVAAYLMQRDRLTRDEALERIRAQRPIIRPNPAFLELLSEWEAELKRPRDSRR